MAKRKVARAAEDDSAGIQYAGEAGASQECQDAVVRLLQYGDEITAARILTCGADHALLLTIGVGDLLAIKSGFASGYGGEGPRRFSYVLQLLQAFGVEIEEYEIAEAVISRLDSSSLRRSDLNKLEKARPLRPRRWHRYIQDRHEDLMQRSDLWEEFPLIIPFAIVDSRLLDLAISFWNAPDDRLLTAYRRLEDIVRKRTGLKEHGVKLFSQAFMGQASRLHWPDLDVGEQAGRTQLFTGVFGAYRNRRAHRELKQYGSDQLAEFLLLNQLFRLELEAVEKQADMEIDRRYEQA